MSVLRCMGIMVTMAIMVWEWVWQAGWSQG